MLWSTHVCGPVDCDTVTFNFTYPKVNGDAFERLMPYIMGGEFSSATSMLWGFDLSECC